MLHYFKQISQSRERKIISLEIAFSAEGIASTTFPVQLQSRKKGVEFTCMEQVSIDSGQWKRTLNKETALLLVFSGKGIITKRIEKTENYQFHIRNILPNADPEEFFWQILDARDHQMVSVIRKNQIQDYLNAVLASGYLVAGIYLGSVNAFPLANVCGISTILIPGYTIQISDAFPEAIFFPSAEIPEPLTIDGKEVKPEYFTALGAGFGYYLMQEEATVNLTSVEELGYRKLLHTIGLGSLAVLMILLAFNMYFKNYYQERYLLLSEIMTSTAGERQEMAGLQLELDEKRELITSTGLTMNHWLAFYANTIGETVPVQILLTDLNVCPLQSKRMEQGEAAEFNAGQILVSGTTPGSEVLHQWVEELKSTDWAKEVIVESFKLKEESDLSHFTLLISLS